ncbi:MAG: DUF305 domain-containing protein [Alphaproteobacteria bacterium]|jgi:uncharacterized protein (DUF305 family)|uniref:DUF305 domain-containing protein n=1 Tax=Brevundimonas aurifodinae TaxID=1508312 RepID=A0ABV1NK05_9CAUL|nr:DUF305 domain-containing protein [Alphaproteobacteria bacterium]OYW39209.1 MAG: DUF305 domain-containing protein [Brevundimonas sp. 12-68-7]OYX32882.1 MAG: DUF305 domain-containing protein [Caulobacterales bacterium 32-69-10]MBU2042402.1 DUF305 domain-containing protein [Alphaproteobacteria bacterium]MBU2125579.1 DUF305 domain-containing protein [Alphaproteobacteria bacterium]
MKRLTLIAAACVLAAACSPQAEPAADETASAMPAGDAMMADGKMGEMDKMGMMAPAAGDSEATRGYKAAMMGQMEKMPAYEGNADIDFMKQMRGHHQTAIAMAQVQLAQGEDAQAKELAQQIITEQEREIAVIDAWLASPAGTEPAGEG